MTSVRVSARPSRIRRRTPPGEPSTGVTLRHVATLPTSTTTCRALLHEYATHRTEIFCLPTTSEVRLRSRLVTRRAGGGVEWLERFCSKDHAHCGCGTRTPPGLGPREIRVRALVSGISHGTELNLYRGTSAFADRVFDRDLRAFVRPDPPRPAYPATLGYELVGTVDEVGAEVARARSPATSSTSARRTARRRCSTWTWPPPRPTRRSASRRAGRSSAGCS